MSLFVVGFEFGSIELVCRPSAAGFSIDFSPLGVVVVVDVDDDDDDGNITSWWLELAILRKR